VARSTGSTAVFFRAPRPTKPSSKSSSRRICPRSLPLCLARISFCGTRSARPSARSQAQTIALCPMQTAQQSRTGLLLNRMTLHPMPPKPPTRPVPVFRLSRARGNFASSASLRRNPPPVSAVLAAGVC
jgi:hypothetical protein